MDRAKARVSERKRRAVRVRRKISGSNERPRLCVRRSLKHIYAQIVNDADGKSIVQLGSNSGEIAVRIAESKKKDKTAVSRAVGELLAEKAREKGVEKVVFDRKGYLYRGRIKALADGARSKGLVL
jgi:large subunit ribosomal protein L18